MNAFVDKIIIATAIIAVIFLMFCGTGCDLQIVGKSPTYITVWQITNINSSLAKHSIEFHYEHHIYSDGNIYIIDTIGKYKVGDTLHLTK